MARLPTDKPMSKSNPHTLPPSPTHSSSSSDFEFTISISPRKISSSALCPADDLFRNGHLLPLHHPSHHRFPTVLPSSSSTAARDSSGSSNDSQHSLFTATDCDSSRPSSVTDDDEIKRFHNPLFFPQSTRFQSHREINKISKTSVITNKYLSSTFSRFSSVFRKDPGKNRDPDNISGSSVKRASATAREVVRKYLKKVKPLYEKFSQKNQNQQNRTEVAGVKPTSFSSLLARTERSMTKEGTEKKQQIGGSAMLSHSFSGNLRHLRRKRSCVSSCPSSMRSSPTHSGAIPRGGGGGGGMFYGSSNSSTMEELQSAIQGAIAHCKNSWIQEKPMVSREI